MGSGKKGKYQDILFLAKNVQVVAFILDELWGVGKMPPPPNFCIKGSFLLSLCKALLNMSCLHTMMHGIRLACKFEVNLNGTINP